jgi:streptogramin lyase
VGTLAVVAVLAAGVVAALLLHGGNPPRTAAQARTPAPTPTATATATASPAPKPRETGVRIGPTFPRVSHRPNAIARVGDELWVTSASRPLLRLDAMTGRPRTRDPRLPAGGKAISERGGRVWVANGPRRDVTALAAAAPHRLLEHIPLPGIPVDLAADPGGGVWVAVRGDVATGPATVFHYGSGGQLVGEYPFPAGVTAIVLALGSLWVAELGDPLIKRLDPHTGAVHIGARLIHVAGSLAAGGGHLWAGIPDDGVIAKITPGHSGDPSFQYAGRRPERLTYARGRLYATCRFDSTLVVLDPRSLKVVKRLDMPLNPFAVTSDGRRVWVTGLGADTVTRVDLN